MRARCYDFEHVSVQFENIAVQREHVSAQLERVFVECSMFDGIVQDILGAKCLLTG